MFTRQHYKAIGQIVKDSVDKEKHVLDGDKLTQKLAQFFEQDNPRFDREKWFEFLNS